MIFVSHDVDAVMEITDKATVLRDVRVAATLHVPKASKSVRARLLGSTSIVPGRFLVTGITGLIFLGFSSFIQEMF